MIDGHDRHPHRGRLEGDHPKAFANGRKSQYPGGSDRGHEPTFIVYGAGKGDQIAETEILG
jgi:hypothetical protein